MFSASLRACKFVAFDTETTGLLPVQDKIIELSAVRFDLESNQYESFNELVNPGFPIPESSSRINGITDQDVQDKPFIKDILIKFSRFVGDDNILLAHNSEFDVHFLGAAYQQENLEFPENEVWDTLAISRGLINNVRDHKLETLVRHYGIKVNTFHRALMDSIYVMEVFKKTLPLCNDFEEIRKLASTRNLSDVLTEIFSVQLPLPLLGLRRFTEQHKTIQFNYLYRDKGKTEVKAFAKTLFKSEKNSFLLAIELENDYPQAFEISRISELKGI